MQVVLLERIERLGQMGQVVEVKTGYARNFLLPQKKALRATKANLAVFEQQKAQLEAANLKRREEAQYVAEKMEGTIVSLVRPASEMGHLYGSVRTNDVASCLGIVGFTVTRNQVNIQTPIKTIGTHAVSIALHPEVSVSVDVVVALSDEEAAVQVEKAKKAKQGPAIAAVAAVATQEA